MHGRAEVRDPDALWASDNPLFDRGALRASKRDYSGMHGVGGIGGSGMGGIGGSVASTPSVAVLGDSE